MTAARICGIPEVMSEDETGFLSDIGDIEIIPQYISFYEHVLNKKADGRA